jgi:hypothetical protein
MFLATPTSGLLLPAFRSRIVSAMSVTINLSPDELAQIKRFTELESEDEAVTKAAREFLRVSQLRELKAASGKVAYQDVAEAMEALELREGRANQ